ncbi:MAG: hypothetical protein HYY04_10375 [Chloroflexi bacterium]|nr:hypothetical protein [Chloroflexota bacterium]
MPDVFPTGPPLGVAGAPDSGVGWRLDERDATADGCLLFIRFGDGARSPGISA